MCRKVLTDLISLLKRKTFQDLSLLISDKSLVKMLISKKCHLMSVLIIQVLQRAPRNMLFQIQPFHRKVSAVE